MIRPLLAVLTIPLLVSGCNTDQLRAAFAREASAQAANDTNAAPRVRRILAKAEDYSSPSPDGRYMTYVDWDTGDVAVLEVATGETRRVTDKGSWAENGSWAEWPKFSSDGESIVYAYGNVRAGTPHRYEIRTVPSSGGESSVLYQFDTHLGWAQPLDWAEPGILLEFYPEDGEGGLALLPGGGGEPEVLLPYGIQGPHAHEATFSPDSRWIAYRFGGQVHLMRPDGSNQGTLTGSAKAILGWSPDGSAIIVHAERSGTTAIWSVPVGNGRQVGDPVLVKVGPPTLAAAGRAGDQYYYMVQVDVPRLYQTSIDLNEGRILTAPTELTAVIDGAALSPAWSPDGSLLAYVHQRTGQPHRVMVRSMRDGDVMEVATIERARDVENLVWDASGHQLYYSIRHTNEETTTVLESVVVETGERETFRLDARIIVAVPGRREAVLFRQRRDDDTRATSGGLFLHDLRTGSETLLTSPKYMRGSGIMTVSPDERTVAWVDGSEDNISTSLMSMPLAGGEPRVVAQRSNPHHLETGRQSVLWSPDGGTIFAVGGTWESNGPHVLNVIPLNGGAAKTIDLPDGLYHTISPDGSRLVFVKGDFKNEMWVLEGLDGN